MGSCGRIFKRCSGFYPKPSARERFTEGLLLNRFADCYSRSLS